MSNTLPKPVSKHARKRPCPFCRLGPLQIVDSARNDKISKCVECVNCGARGPIYGDSNSAELGWLHGEADGHTNHFSTSVPNMEEALLHLVIHDVAADKREKLPHCLELQNAIRVLKEDCGYTDNIYSLEGLTEREGEMHE